MHGEVVKTLLVATKHRAYAFPLSDVSEVMRPLPTQSLLGVPDFVAGVTVIRGMPLPVIDLGMLLEGRSSRTWGRFVTVKSGTRTVALAVDEVIGVRGYEASQLAELPPLLRDAGEAVIEALGTADAQLLVVLRGSRLVPEAVWGVLARQAAPT